MLMSRPTPSLSAPVEISKWWRNRGGEAIMIWLLTWKNRNVIDARVWHSAEGQLRPTTKGLTVGLKHLPKLVSALAAACSRARELGLLDDDGGDR
jgi:hypothetical protein